MFNLRHTLLVVLALGAVLIVPATTAQEANRSERDAIVFDSNRDGEAGIFVMDSNGANVRRVVLAPSGRMSGFPDWSPDRERIAFASDRDGPMEIYVVNVDGTNIQRLTHSPTEIANLLPDWSPDGSKIAAVQSPLGSSREIHVMNVDGSNDNPVTPTMLRAGFPAWSPDGTKLAFASYQTFNIYVMNADGSEALPITHAPPGAANVPTNAPAWSPDGKRIMFDTRWGGDWDIWLIDADGSNQRQLTRVGANTARAAWSPDGKSIVFHSTRDRPTGNGFTDSEIYAMDADGSQVRRLTSNGASDGHPDWR